MPPRIECAGRHFHHVETFKHDFFAATGLYRDANGRLAILKLGRQTELLGFPMTWAARFLTRREAWFYQRLADCPGVPGFIGTVLNDTGFLHDFVPGHPLGRDEQVGDAFFDQLRRLLDTIHERHMAYVDLNKRQNILAGDDGRPYLIDFQISLYVPPDGWGRVPGLRRLLRVFQAGDVYHYAKHKRRLRPDLLSESERQRTERLSIWIRLHRAVARPLTNLRRRFLRRLQRGGNGSVAGASAK